MRHRGTIGGSLAHGDPASDLPAVMLALGAELVVRGAARRACRPGVRLLHRLPRVRPRARRAADRDPRPEARRRAGWSFQKFNRRAQDWAIVGVAAIVRRKNGTVDSAAIGLVSMAGTPLRARPRKRRWQAVPVGRAAAPRAEGTSRPTIGGSSEYRAHLVTVVGRRALEEALAR